LFFCPSRLPAIALAQARRAGTEGQKPNAAKGGK